MINDIERLQTRCTLLEGRLAKLEQQVVDMFDTLTAVVDHLSASAKQDERAPEREAIAADAAQLVQALGLGPQVDSVP